MIMENIRTAVTERDTVDTMRTECPEPSCGDVVFNVSSACDPTVLLLAVDMWEVDSIDSTPVIS